MDRVPCPRCGDHGDVTVTSRPSHAASCALCGGSFAPTASVLPQLLATGIEPGDIKRRLDEPPADGRPCPVCTKPLATFPVKGELVHGCRDGAVMWLDAGALDRIAAPDDDVRIPARSPEPAAAVEPSSKMEGRPSRPPEFKPRVQALE